MKIPVSISEDPYQPPKPGSLICPPPAGHQAQTERSHAKASGLIKHMSSKPRLTAKTSPLTVSKCGGHDPRSRDPAFKGGRSSEEVKEKEWVQTIHSLSHVPLLPSFPPSSPADVAPAAPACASSQAKLAGGGVCSRPTRHMGMWP